MTSRRGRPPLVPLLLGLGAVAAARLLTLPATLWEWDEVLFVRGVERFEPLAHHPHPPGYPLLVGLGKLAALVACDPFRGLVALGVLASLAGFVALVDAYRRLAAPPDAGPAERAAADRAAVAGAALFHLSPAMLVYGPLALSDAPALALLALALAAAARIDGAPVPAAAAAGAFASAAIGVRPQLALAVVPMLGAALLFARRRPAAGVGFLRRPLVAGVAAFAVVSALWFAPLVLAIGGPRGLVPYLTGQAGNVLVFDMEQPRAGLSAAAIATRFLAHPWGSKVTALPVLVLALAGAAALCIRARRSGRGLRTLLPLLPLAVLAAVELALCLIVLHPDDAARYALPSMLAVAFFAGVGCAAAAGALRPARPGSLPADAGRTAYVLAAALAAGFAAFAWPLLAARATTPSPPVQAALWLERAQPARPVVLVEPSLAAHADLLLPGFPRRPVAAGVPASALMRGGPVWLLGDGESALPGARTFRWPNSDAYGKLTRRHYGVVSLSPLPEAERFEVLAGVHAAEPSPRDPEWRWLEGEAAIRLAGAGGAGRPVVLKLRLPGNVPWPANAVTVSAAGREVATVVLRRGELRRVELPPWGDGPVEVGFRSRRAFVPAASGLGPDYRRLAVQLVGIERPALVAARARAAARSPS